MARLSVALLGAPEIRHGGRLLRFPTRKTLGLLAYLIVEGGSHRREKLIALLWPESDDVAGRATLRSSLARARGVLAEPSGRRHLAVERDVVGFDFASDFELDLQRLQSAYAVSRPPISAESPANESGQTIIRQLEEAVDRWRGEFLEGFSLPDAPEFDDWVRFQREAWQQRLEVVLERLAQLYADQGMTASAIETTTRSLSLNPLDEPTYRRLMQFHFVAGDRAAAIQTYETCRELLGRELRARPEPETEALAERIRSSVPARRAPARRSVAPTPSFSNEPMVGRTSEFIKLVELYHAVCQGGPRVVCLQGEAGIGKTRLATEFLGWAAGQGADVLQGRAFEMSGRLPYQPLVDALRPRFDRENAPEDLLSDVWLVELSRLLPELRGRYPDLPPPGADDAAARVRLYEAIARLVQALAGRAPVVLMVDDLQWVDAASLDVLRYAARRWAEDGASVLLLFCLRSEAPAAMAALDEWLMGLRRDLSTTRLALEPFTFDDTARLAQGLARSEWRSPEITAFARWLFDETSGQPLFVIETLNALLDQDILAAGQRADGRWEFDLITRLADLGAQRGLLPPGVRWVIHGRLTRLTLNAREFLMASAVLGQEFTFEQACQVHGLSVNDSLRALDEAVESSLIGETGHGCYVFAHDKIREVVYLEAGDARRRAFHHRALDAVEATAAPAELARHAFAAELDELALRYSIAAGAEAMNLLAARDAASHFERAMIVAERLHRHDVAVDLHARRGRAFASVALWADARRELEVALTGLGADQPERRAEILVDLAEVSWWCLDIPTVRGRAAEAMALVENHRRGDLETRAIAWFASAEGSDGNLGRCVDQNERAIARARELQIAPPARALMNQSLARYWLGHLGEAVAGSREAVDAARDARDVPQLISSLPQLGIALAGIGRYSEAARAFDEARQLGHDYGVEGLLARSIAMSAGFHLDVFDFDGAEALSREARELALSCDFPPPATSAGLDLLMNFARRQEVDRAEKLVRDVAAVAEQAVGFHGWLWRIRLAESRAEIALARGDWEEAVLWASETISQSQARHRLKYQAVGLVTRARALAARGRTRDALGDLRRAVGLARTMGDPALLLRVAAALLSIDGDVALAAEAATAVERITTALPDADMQRRFEGSELVRIVAR